MALSKRLQIELQAELHDVLADPGLRAELPRSRRWRMTAVLARCYGIGVEECDELLAGEAGELGAFQREDGGC